MKENNIEIWRVSRNGDTDTAKDILLLGWRRKRERVCVVNIGRTQYERGQASRQDGDEGDDRP